MWIYMLWIHSLSTLENTDESKIFFVRSPHCKHFGKAQHLVLCWALWWHQISHSLLVNPSHTHESWEGQNTCLWIYIYIYIIHIYIHINIYIYICYINIYYIYIIYTILYILYIIYIIYISGKQGHIDGTIQYPLYIHIEWTKFNKKGKSGQSLFMNLSVHNHLILLGLRSFSVISTIWSCILLYEVMALTTMTENFLKLFNMKDFLWRLSFIEELVTTIIVNIIAELKSVFKNRRKYFIQWVY